MQIILFTDLNRPQTETNNSFIICCVMVISPTPAGSFLLIFCWTINTIEHIPADGCPISYLTLP